MCKNVLFTAVVILFISSCNACTNPQVTAKSFSTQDATIVTHIAYVAEFDVECSSGTPPNLFAALDNGVITPVAAIGPKSFQVSWTEETKSAKTGERVIRIFDEEGYSTLKKALRLGESTANVEPFFNVTVSYWGAYGGPWVKSEFIAALLSLSVAYLAISSRGKIVA